MMNIILPLSCLIALAPTLTLANKDVSQEQVMAQRCLTFGLNKLKADDQGLYAKLQTARPNASTTVIERFDENIDSQHVAIRVTASLEPKQGTTGEMM